MSTDPRLETYLAKMEKVLGPFPVSDRAEIIIEIKSHVEAALERDPQAPLDSILAALGEPETVANRYLMERGMKPSKPPISPIVKWLVIGFLGTLALSMTLIVFVLLKFSPVFKIDGEQDRVSLLGGSIEISGEDGTVKIGDSLISGGDWSSPWEDSWMPSRQDETFRLELGEGKLELVNSPNQKLSWECRTHRGVDPSEVKPRASANQTVLDLGALRGVKCLFRVPEKLKLAVNAEHAKLEVDRPHYNLDVRLTDGKIALQPDESKGYHYELSTEHGKVDSFSSSDAPEAYKISIHVTHGKITRAE